MFSCKFGAAALIAAAVLSGCGGGRGEQAADAGNTPGFAYHDFYLEFRDSVWGFEYGSGKWASDQGDAAFYGIAYYVSSGTAEKKSDYLARAGEARSRDIGMLRKANEDFSYLMANLEEVMMSSLGLIEYVYVTGDTAPVGIIDTFIDSMDGLVDSLGPYLEVEMDSWALKMYGPTTITGVIALINLRYADLLKNKLADARQAFGEKIIAAVDAKAFDGKGYRFSTKTDKLYLYPNVMMILANSVAFTLTKKQAYLDRCLSAYQAIQPLKDLDRKGYHSPYSAEHQGAKTDDYSTLSSQNYAIMAMAMLYELTSDGQFKKEIEDIVSFIHDKLYVGGRLLHHWMDGRVAVPADPEYFCSGCNLQFLYAIWYVERNLYGY